jgi:release factor glutamine methyltransferase
MRDLSIKKQLQFATIQLPASSTPQLDAQILLAHCLKKPISYLLTWPEKNILPEQGEHFLLLLTRRGQGEPIAHLVGHRAFWSLDLKITKDTLIPRPETELLITLILKSISEKKTISLVDLGTGSGAIALSLAQERPHWQITATEKSAAALLVAQENARLTQIDHIVFLHANWCKPFKKNQFDIIVSNPPYIAPNDPHLINGDVRFEPRGALIADDDGLKDLKQIITQATHCLKPGGQLFLEHGFEQGPVVRDLLANAGFMEIKTHKDLAGLDRVSAGVSV